jgi:hypothetical protein
MAPITYQLVSLSTQTQSKAFIDALASVSESQKLVWVGQCHQWMHEPQLSADSLTGVGTDLKKWDYLLITKIPEFLSSIKSFLSDRWSITVEVDDAVINGFSGKFPTEQGPELLPGWTSDNHSALDASEAPADLVTSLDTRAPVMGKSKTDSKISIRTFVRDFGTSSPQPRPIAMFNLLSFLPQQMPQYFKYVEAFTSVLGKGTGAKPLIFGFDVHGWSTKEEDAKKDEGPWEGAALIWYPSIWYFGQMLGDETYAQLDRDYKGGVVRDNAILCCTEVSLESA